MRYVRWFIRAVRPYWMQLTVMMMCHVLIAGCAIGFVYVSKKLVDVAVAVLSGKADPAELTLWAFYMAGIVVSRILLNALRTYLQTTTEIKLKNSLRKRTFDVLLHLQSDGGTKHHSGDVLNRMQEDVRVVSSAFVSSIPNLVGIVLQFATAFIFLVSLDARLAVLILVIVPVGLLVAKFITSRVRNLTLDIRRSDSKVQAHLQESLQHITLLQSLEYTDTSASALDGLQGALYGNEIRRTRFSVISRKGTTGRFSNGY